MGRFDFVVIGIPRTSQTKKPASRQKWKNAVSEVARRRWLEAAPAPLAEATVAVVYFYRDKTDLDVDGIGKLVIDAMQGIAFSNDAIVTEVILRKTNQGAILSIESPEDVLKPYFGLTKDFVYVAVSKGPDHESLPI
jgi:Holliday junction resolvase RusA-like endonuclease